MSNVLVGTTPRDTIAIDPRIQAYLAPQCRNVFRSIATPSEIWRADPFDVDTIHLEARSEFERLLNLNGRNLSPSGSILLLHGEAGSGKTHLMRAFRTRAHSQAAGFVCYLQMATETDHYPRYLLKNVIDALQQPYDADLSSKTSFQRLTDGLFETLRRDYLPAYAARANRTLDEFVEQIVNEPKNLRKCADLLLRSERFASCDLDLLRVLLHVHRNDAKVSSRAFKWLRCEDVCADDRVEIGDVSSRSDGEDPARMLKQLASLIQAVHGVPLILLVDQLEDIADLSEPAERFRRVVNSLVAFTEGSPNAIVVMACLEDYFDNYKDQLPAPKLQRLVRDPEPIRLPSRRTGDEIHAMLARRLQTYYDSQGLNFDDDSPIYPFRAADLVPLHNLSTRDVLYFFQQHSVRCNEAGKWLAPEIVRPPVTQEGPPSPATDANFDALWNDFHSAFEVSVPDNEAAFSTTLATAICDMSAELSGDNHFECHCDGSFIEIEIHYADSSVDKVLLGVCNASYRGRAFIEQLGRLKQRAGEHRVVIVRSTEFPKSGLAATEIASMIRSRGQKVSVADADWRRMQAFAKFSEQQKSAPGFETWQRSARPLGELDSLQRILALADVNAKVTQLELANANPHSPVAPSFTLPPATVPENDDRSTMQSREVDPDNDHDSGDFELSSRLDFGHSLSLVREPIQFDPQEFTQHAAFLGGSGSGKTTAALNLIEQLLMRDIPAVLLDRKGDLCRYLDPGAWQRPLEPANARKREWLRAKLDMALYTPGESKGRPLSLPMVPDGFMQLAESDRERFSQFAAGALGSMIGFKTSPADRGQRAILAKAIETLASKPGMEFSLARLRQVIAEQDDALLTAIGGEYPPRYYSTLAERLLTLELNDRSLFNDGERLNVDALLGKGEFSRPGRVRLSVISTRFLGDASKVDFWVSQLLSAVIRWCAKSPQPKLQAVFLFDEADIYLPAGMRQPATKSPMEDLLKRARSAGVGVFLATQSPGDLDYKCKENLRSWFIGNVKQETAINKLKPLLSASKADVSNKLASQKQGDFYLARESSVQAVHANESLIRTEQLSEEAILQLAMLRSTLG